MSSGLIEQLPSRRILLLGVASAVALAIAVFAFHRFELGWIGAVAIAVIIGVFAVLWFRAGEERAIRMGNFSPAMKRYNRRMLAGGLAYVVGLFAAIFAHDNLPLTSVAAFAVALLPSAGVLWMVRAMARLIADEQDEYLRYRYVRSSLFGLGTLLTLATIWGFFEQFELVPHVPTWAAVPVFGLGLGIASCTRWGIK